MNQFSAGALTIIACLLLAVTARGDHNCLNFDGANDYVMVPYNAALSLTNTATIETWVKPVYSTGIRTICTRTKYYGNPNGYRLMMWGQTMRFMWGNGNTNYIDVFSSSQIPADTWTHVAVTYEGTTVKWYFNGTLNCTATVSSVTIAASSDSILLAKMNEPGYSYMFGGSLDRLRIWNYARTQEQIQADMNTDIAPGTTGLVAQYTFNQGVAGGDNPGINTLCDSSGAYGKGSPIDGILHNFALNGSSSNWVVSAAPAGVEMNYFTAAGSAGLVQLAWSTASENNSANWIIERSNTTSKGYSEIGRLDAAGNTNGSTRYTFSDHQVEPGKNYYYRIAEQEQNGALTYYGPVQAMAGLIAPSAGLVIQAWPNPFRGSIKLQCRAQSQVQVYDLTGRFVRELNTANGEVVWDGLDRNGHRLGAGVYFLHAVSPGSDVTRKITKLE